MKRGCTLQGLVGTFAKQEFETGTSPLIIAKRRPNWPPFYCSLNVVGDFFCGVSAILRFLQLPFGLVPELIVPSIWPVALFPEFVSTLSDLIFCWLIHCALPPSTACPGGLSGEKGQGCVGRNCEYDPISQFEPATLVPKRKTRLARQAPSGVLA